MKHTEQREKWLPELNHGLAKSVSATVDHHVYEPPPMQTLLAKRAAKQGRFANLDRSTPARQGLVSSPLNTPFLTSLFTGTAESATAASDASPVSKNSVLASRMGMILQHSQSWGRTVLLIYTGLLTLLVLSLFTSSGYRVVTDFLNGRLIAVPLDMLVMIMLVFFLAGSIKGVVGLGLTTFTVPIIALFYNPLLVATLVAIPLIVTNFRQGVLTSHLSFTIRHYSPMMGTMTLTMATTAYHSSYFSASLISISVGLMAISFAIVSLKCQLPKIPDAHDRLAQLITGTTTGIAGGLSGIVAIPLVFYVINRTLEKDVFVSVIGLHFFVAGLALMAGHGMNGMVSGQLVLLSVFATVPALLGILFGEALRQHINQAVFRKIVLCIVFLIGVRIVATEQTFF